MNRTLLVRTWRAQRVKVLVVAVALAAWGFLMPIVYAAYGAQFEHIVASGLIPKEITDLISDVGGGNIFTLGGAIALGFIHPIAVALICVFAIGFAASAVAGERQRGTLEVLLARPISRRSLILTLYAATVGFVVIALAAFLVGTAVASALWGVAGELDLVALVALGLNGALMFAAFGAVCLAASVSFDRLPPALGIGLGYLLISYFIDVLGSLWPDARGLQPLSLFHYVRAPAVLSGRLDPADLVVLVAVSVVAVAYALWRFPQRDIAAPS
jgi:ABC-2 type transport system permease protein